MNENARERGVIAEVPSSIFGRPRNARESRRSRQIKDMLMEKETTMNHLFSFKMYPSTDPEMIETRPLPKSCTTCLPQGDIAVQEEMKRLGLIDCFIPFTMSSHNSIFSRKFPFYTHYSKCIKDSELHRLPLWQEMATDPGLFELFQEQLASSPASMVATKQDVLRILCNLQVANVWSSFQRLFMQVTSWICQKYLSLHFESVLVHGGQIELLREIQSKKLPVIYIPTYRSKFDNTLILWTLAHNGLRTPLFFRDHKSKYKFLKYFGGIGASLDVIPDPNSEKKYCSAVTVYLKHLLRKGNNIMLNLESGRSRCGRPSPNVYGTELLKVIFDEYMCNHIEDAYFVPVSVSYELLPDGKEIFEGGKSTPFSIFSFLKAFASGILFPNSTRKGMVKVDFGQPTCFRELHTSLQKNVKIQRLNIGIDDSYHRSRNCSYLKWSSSESLNSISSLYGELAPLYPYDPENPQAATLLDVVNHHLVYDAGKSESVMPTHLLAFILIKKCRNGVYLEQLKDEMQWLVKIVRASGKDFGFSIIDCDMESIAFRAAELLKDDIICQWSDEKNTLKFEVRSEISSLRKLEYHANYLLPEFMMEAVIATAIFAMRGPTLSCLRGFDSEIRIRDDEFMLHCRRVYEVLTGGFLLHPPCLSAESAIRKQVSQMTDRGLLILVMRETRKYMWEDDMDDYEIEEPIIGANKNREIVDQDFTFVPEEIKVTTTESTFVHLSFYRRLLMPYFETFAFLTGCLEILLEKDQNRMHMTDLEKYLLEKLMENSEKDLSHCRELCSRYTVKQFLFTCEDHGILLGDMEEGEMDPFYQLKKNTDELKGQVDDLLFYVTV